MPAFELQARENPILPISRVDSALGHLWFADLQSSIPDIRSIFNMRLEDENENSTTWMRFAPVRALERGKTAALRARHLSSKRF